MCIYTYNIVKTEYGDIILYGRGDILYRLILSKIKDYPDIKGQYIPTAFFEIKKKLISYFEGKEVDFCPEKILRQRESFGNNRNLAVKKLYKDVWSAIAQIPYGRVLAYSDIAKKLNISPRLVGLACKKNPLPIIIPCHRVIKSDGSLGGFSEGIFWKKLLLKIEKINYGENLFYKKGFSL